MRGFAERLKQIQKQKGMTQKELALKLEMSPTTLSAYMRDAKSPSLDVAYNIANKLNVSIGWLCGESGASGTLLSYADLLRMLVKTVDESSVDFHVANITERDANPYAETYSELTTSDRVVCCFFEDWCRVRDLFKSGTIDTEMYEGWLEKRLKKYENTPLRTKIYDDEGLPF